MVEVLRTGIEDALLKKLDEFAQPFRNARFRPGPVKVGVGFQNVKMIVHGLLLVHVLVAKPRVGIGLRPITTAHFQITTVFRIVRVPLDQLKQLNRPFQRGLPAESPVIFGKGVNVKRLAIDFFGIVQHVPGVVQPPERAAVLRVPEAVHDEIQRPIGHLLEELFGPGAVSGGECPKNAAVNDKSLGLRAVGLEVIGQPTHPAALFVIQRRSAPERQDVAE